MNNKPNFTIIPHIHKCGHIYEKNLFFNKTFTYFHTSLRDRFDIILRSLSLSLSLSLSHAQHSPPMFGKPSLGGVVVVAFVFCNCFVTVVVMLLFLILLLVFDVVVVLLLSLH